MAEQYLTVAQAADLLGVQPETIRVHIRKGELKAIRNKLKAGQPLLIPESAFQAFKVAKLGELAVE